MTNSVKEALNNIINFFIFCIFIYAFYCLTSLHGYNKDKEFIKNKENFKKVKIKIDSVYIHGNSDRYSTKEYQQFFSKNIYLFELDKNYDSKPLFGSKRKFLLDEVNHYRKEHHDSINIWYLNDNFILYANESEKSINLSEKIENVNSLKIQFTICVSFVLIILCWFLIKKKSKSL
jgi:hypothetical protein